jgi:hypothetical protein
MPWLIRHDLACRTSSAGRKKDKRRTNYSTSQEVYPTVPEWQLLSTQKINTALKCSLLTLVFLWSH